MPYIFACLVATKEQPIYIVADSYKAVVEKITADYDEEELVAINCMGRCYNG